MTMLYNEFNLDLKYKKDFLSIEMEDQGAMELSDQEEEQLVDRGCIGTGWSPPLAELGGATGTKSSQSPSFIILEASF